MADYGTAVDPAAFTNAFNQQIALGQQRRQQQLQNQLAQQQDFRAQQELAIRQQQADQSAQQFGFEQQKQKVEVAQDFQTRASTMAANLSRMKLPPDQLRAASLQGLDALAPEAGLAGIDINQQKAALSSMSDEQLQQVIDYMAAQAPKAAPVNIKAGESLVNPITGQQIYRAAGNVEYKDAGDKLVPVDSVTGQPRTDVAPIPKKMTPNQVFMANGGNLGKPGVSELAAAFAMNGVPFPRGATGPRLGTLLQGLIDQNPGKSPDDIAKAVGAGTIGFGAATKGAQTAGAQVGKVSLAENELHTFGQQALDASANVPRGKFVPWNTLKQYADSQISDPQLLQFKTAMTSLKNAYDQLASRGGTDAEKRAESSRLFSTANSPEAVQAIVRQVQREAAGAHAAGSKSVRDVQDLIRGGGGDGTKTQSGATVSNW